MSCGASWWAAGAGSGRSETAAAPAVCRGSLRRPCTSFFRGRPEARLVGWGSALLQRTSHLFCAVGWLHLQPCGLSSVLPFLCLV